MTSKRDDHSLVGAYAVHALDDRERQQFERHLAHCRDCTDELRGFVETTARLAAGAPAKPRPELKSAVLAAAARTRQLPAATARNARRVPSLAAATPRARIVGVAAAMLLLAVTAAFFAEAQRTTQHRLHTARRDDALVATVLSAPDATVLSARVATGGTAHVVMAASQHALIFSASALPPLDRTKCYELWLIHAGRDDPGGTLPTPTEGMVGPIPMSGFRPGDVLGISVERAGGSPSPTAPMLAEFAL